jgi:hypothetical protein
MEMMMPSGNGNTSKKAKPKVKKAASKSNGNGKSWLQKGEDAASSAWRGAGDVYNKSQTARRDIWKGVKRSNGGN